MEKACVTNNRKVASTLQTHKVQVDAELHFGKKSRRGGAKAKFEKLVRCCAGCRRHLFIAIAIRPTVLRFLLMMHNCQLTRLLTANGNIRAQLTVIAIQTYAQII